MTTALATARAALAAGDPLAAYDAAATAAAERPDDLEAQYLVALSLARSGARSRAGLEIGRLEAALHGSGAPPRLWEDVQALAARLVKDRALAETGRARAALARDAAERYERVAQRLGRFFSSVNAATLWLIAGEETRAHAMARLTLDYTTDDADEDADDAYWRHASRAEAFLVLEDTDAARAQLVAAMSSSDVGVALRATTRRQLAVLCAHFDQDVSLLDVLDVPSVVHYCGHRASPGSTVFAGAAEDHLIAAVDRVLTGRHAGIGYGSAASGADIIVAERLLERGAELHVVLPFDPTDFERISVRPAGPRWSQRFHSLLERATSVTTACDSAYLNDDELFAYATHIAMGHAVHRAATLATEVSQLALWDRHPSDHVGGTAHAVALWQRAGHATDVVTTQNEQGVGPRGDPQHPLRPAIRAVLFTDLRGFSRLHDEHYPAFLSCVLAPMVAAIEPFREAVVFHKTWGDAVHMVFSDVASAGQAALAMQETCNGLDLASMDLPADLGLRIGGHAGRLLEMSDPLDGTMSWWGRTMTRAARIEPRTPEGEVYVTDAFAALLTLESNVDLACEYVGHMTTAKEFETIPMYRLARKHASASSGDPAMVGLTSSLTDP
jgi:hypothetical protein